MSGPEAIVMEKWKRAKGTKLGRWFFSRGIGRLAPYTGTIGARVELLETGRSSVRMRDRKAIRNHLDSIHAVALANLTELSGSLAIIASMQPKTRMIPVRLETEYLEKARGTVTAEGRCEIPEPGFEGELVGKVSIRDLAGDEVARGKVTAVIGPREQSTESRVKS
jgi:acyl-coenzyme A thioesterase PaaI-like protein